jgi:hypothetical protein
VGDKRRRIKCTDCKLTVFKSFSENKRGRGNGYIKQPAECAESLTSANGEEKPPNNRSRATPKKEERELRSKSLLKFQIS